MAVKAKRPLVAKRPSKPRSEAAIAEQFERTTGHSADAKPKEYRAFRAQQRGETPERRRDDQPSSAGPRGGSRVAPGARAGALASKTTRSLDRRLKGFLRLGVANPRQVLILEMMAALVIVTVDQLSHGDAPTPRAYVAVFVVYLVLGFASEVGGNSGARVATGLGLLVLVTLVMANAPGIVTALGVVSGGRRGSVEEGVG